jgi:hypothetical protein
MKDVDSCEKPRGAANSFDPGISEWGNPLRVIPSIPVLNT